MLAKSPAPPDKSYARVPVLIQPLTSTIAVAAVKNALGAQPVLVEVASAPLVKPVVPVSVTTYKQTEITVVPVPKYVHQVTFA